MLIRKQHNIHAITHYGHRHDYRPTAMGIMLLLLSIIALGASITPLQAQTNYSVKTSSLAKLSNADVFYLRALKLEKLGIKAPFDADFKPLIAQAKKSYRSVELQNKNAVKRGKPLYCNTENEKLPPRQVLRQLGQIPKAKRQNMSLSRAFLLIAQKKYPCRK